MKIISTFVLITVSLCAGLCCPPEEDYNYESIQIQNDHLINIENDQNTFQLNDTIYINTVINNIQKTIDGIDINLTDYLITEEAPSLFYNMTLYKETNFGTPVKITVTNDNLIVINGSVENTYDSLIEVKNNYNDNDIDFKSKFGIKLLEKGSYYLASPNTDYINQIEIYGNTIDNYQLLITSKIRNSDENSIYRFTVE
ncbi:hypothetical protein [uncultured Algibacter sp.]|uniref:hypothetical protein n=1 Tax=uncultured Algibacter sp. TaxID=298659 RepID=UPI002603C4B4|nr:hypothetical protein [uncultured Algibacter sp.]